ncbi:MAG: hypothetical protein FJ087_10070 [Deltaproteobacteria bacterium]|nr:hypothetical protein [Deltaproteobacteria bacterium]
MAVWSVDETGNAYGPPRPSIAYCIKDAKCKAVLIDSGHIEDDTIVVDRPVRIMAQWGCTARISVGSSKGTNKAVFRVTAVGSGKVEFGAVGKPALAGKSAGLPLPPGAKNERGRLRIVSRPEGYQQSDKFVDWAACVEIASALPTGGLAIEHCDLVASGDKPGVGIKVGWISVPGPKKPQNFIENPIRLTDCRFGAADPGGPSHPGDAGLSYGIYSFALLAQVHIVECTADRIGWRFVGANGFGGRIARCDVTAPVLLSTQGDQQGFSTFGTVQIDNCLFRWSPPMNPPDPPKDHAVAAVLVPAWYDPPKKDDFTPHGQGRDTCYCGYSTNPSSSGGNGGGVAGFEKPDPHQIGWEPTYRFFIVNCTFIGPEASSSPEKGWVAVRVMPKAMKYYEVRLVNCIFAYWPVGVFVDFGESNKTKNPVFANACSFYKCAKKVDSPLKYGPFLLETSPAGAPGFVTADPLYHLATGSKCIDKGVPPGEFAIPWIASPALNKNGGTFVSRPKGLGWDVGCYEV